MSLEQLNAVPIDADTLDGKDSKDLGASIDNNTLVKLANGEFAVRKPSRPVLADFETDKEGWSDTSTNSATVTRSSNDSDRGSYSLHLENNSSGVAKTDKDFDVTDYQTIYVRIRAVYSDGRVYYDGSQVTTVNEGGGWKTASIDVSNDSGTHNIEVRASQFDDADYNIYFDHVYADIPSGKTEEPWVNS